MNYDSYDDALNAFLQDQPFRFVDNFRFAFIDNKKQMTQYKREFCGIDYFEQECFINGRAAIFSVNDGH